MNMTAHTPGPWRAEPRDSGGLSIMAKSDVVAQTNRYGPTLPCVEANARLIAAAPDLLAALKECEAYFRPMAEDGQYLAQQRIDRIRAAIAKAEGR